MRDTSYAREIASVRVGEARLERLLIKSTGEEEIRFSWWKDGRFQARPLDVPESVLLKLLVKGMKGGVLSPSFEDDLRDAGSRAR